MQLPLFDVHVREPERFQLANNVSMRKKYYLPSFATSTVYIRAYRIHGSIRIFEITSIFKYKTDKNVLAKHLHKSSVIGVLHSTTNKPTLNEVVISLVTSILEVSFGHLTGNGRVGYRAGQDLKSSEQSERSPSAWPRQWTFSEFLSKAFKSKGTFCSSGIFCVN